MQSASPCFEAASPVLACRFPVSSVRPGRFLHSDPHPRTLASFSPQSIDSGRYHYSHPSRLLDEPPPTSLPISRGPVCRVPHIWPRPCCPLPPRPSAHHLFSSSSILDLGISPCSLPLRGRIVSSMDLLQCMKAAATTAWDAPFHILAAYFAGLVVIYVRYCLLQLTV